MNFTKQIFSKRCWLQEKLQPATICIAEGRIVEIHKHKLQSAEDVADDILMPGVIDAHVHINEPGRTDWEGFESGTQAAAAGGITTIVDMPLNSNPVTTSVTALNKKLAASKNKLHVNVGFYGGLIPGNQGNIEGLIKAGVLGIKCFLTHSGIDEFPNVVQADIENVMPVIAKMGVPLLAHCELETIKVESGLSSFPTSYQRYVASRPKQWENDAVDLMIKLCKKHQCKIHIVHVSSAEALPAIAIAKKQGLPLTAETCPHYIYFNAEDIPDANCLYKCAPPIREEENNNFLKLALKNHTLNFIASDHSPSPPLMKELNTGNLQKAWGGIAGLQFLLPVSWTALKEIISIEEFIPLLTSEPAKFLEVHQRKGTIDIGYDADLVIWRPHEKFKVEAKDIFHRYDCSPYCGQQLFGTIQQTIVNGQTVYYQHKIIQKNKGQWLLKK